MATRPLRRLGLEPAVLHQLASRNITLASDLFLKTDLEIVESTDLPYAVVAAMKQRASLRLAPAPCTMLDLLKSAATRMTHLPTHLEELDTALRGGVPCGGITELVGPAGVGKSQFCSLLALSAVLAPSETPGAVIYLDTEHKFSAVRLAEMAAARWPARFANPDALREAAARIWVVRPTNSTDLLKRLQVLDGAVIDHGARLIIVDSIASLLRSEYGAGQIQERQQILGQQAALLKYLAETFRIPVVATNQVTTQFHGPVGHDLDVVGPSEPAGGTRGRGGGGHLTAALGTLWAHAVNTRLVLEASNRTHFVKIAKSPAAPNAAFAYTITDAGPQLQEFVGVAVPQGSVLNMAIARELADEYDLSAF